MVRKNIGTSWYAKSPLRVIIAILIAACWLVSASPVFGQTRIIANTPPAPLEVKSVRNMQRPKRDDPRQT